MPSSDSGEIFRSSASLRTVSSLMTSPFSYRYSAARDTPERAAISSARSPDSRR
jgi:hypothetical protein